MKKRAYILGLCAVLVLLIANVLAVICLYAPLLGRTSLTNGLPEQADTLVVADTLHAGAHIDSIAKVSDQSAVIQSVDKGDIKSSTAAKTSVLEQILIPDGPFEVKNSATGKTNTLSQKSDFTLEMRDEKGQTMWAMSLPGKICGRVAQLDYFANGKLQYLFICGRKLYLVDRLGRNVNGFPVDLQNDVLLGPDVYDFNATKHYNILVINTDGGIDLYNLKGQKPSSWKTIRPDDALIGMPDLLEVGKKSYWVVRSAEKSDLYGFYGDFVKSFAGEPVAQELK